MKDYKELYKGIILSDLDCVFKFYNSDIKPERLLAAYHMQQAIEKTIKLKVGLLGDDTEHNIGKLLRYCSDNGIDINVPDYIVKHSDMITSWEYDWFDGAKVKEISI